MEFNYHILWGAFAVAFAVAVAMTPVSIWLAPKIGAMDIPKDDRRMHTRVIPRFGGMAIFLGICLRVCKNAIEIATEIKQENDLTI